MVNIAFDYVEIPEFRIEYKKTFSEVKSFHVEVVNTAKFIKSCTSKPIMIALSGGIDSEVAARGFIKSKIPFEALTFVHKENTNHHDISHAIDFCKKNNIKHHLLELDVDKFFLNEEFVKYIDAGYKATNIFRYLQLHILETINDMGYTAVMGGGEQIYRNIDNKVCLTIHQSMVNSLNWCKNNNVLHFPYFFHTRPELVVSYLKDKLITFLVNNSEYYDDGFKSSAYSIEKMLVYHKNFKGMAHRNKFSGFENIKKQRNILQRKLSEQFTDLQTISISIEDILKDCCRE